MRVCIERVPRGICARMNACVEGSACVCLCVNLARRTMNSFLDGTDVLLSASRSPLNLGNHENEFIRRTGTTVLVNVNNAYNTYQFNGEKAVVLSTVEWIGGKNYFVGYSYIGVGITSLFMGLIYLILHVRYPRQLGDMEALSWRKKGLNIDSAVHKTS